MSYLDRLKLAVDQKASGVTGDQTSPWDRALPVGRDESGNLQAGHLLTEMGGVYTRWWDNASKSFDNPLLKNPDGSPRPFSSLSSGQQAAVALRTASISPGGNGTVGLRGTCQRRFANLTSQSLRFSQASGVDVMCRYGHAARAPSPAELCAGAPEAGRRDSLPSRHRGPGNHLKTLIGGCRRHDVATLASLTCVAITPFFRSRPIVNASSAASGPLACSTSAARASRAVR